MKFKKLTEDARIPTRSKEDDAGLDLYCLEQTIVQPGEVVKINTQIACEIPVGYVGLILDRSSLGCRGIRTLAGVVDSNYRGPLIVCLTNINSQHPTTYNDLTVSFNKYDRIAQLVVIPYLKEDPEEVLELSDSQRQEQGFGSSGK